MESAQARPPPSLAANPLAYGADGSLQALTCPARALFHALLPPLLSGPESRFSEPPRPDSASLLGRRRRPRAGRSHPRLSGSDNPGCLPLRGALRSCPRSRTRPRRGTATRGGAPGSPPPHTRAHAPRPQASLRQATPALPEAPRDQFPSLDAGTLSPHPLFTVTGAPRQSPASSIKHRGVYDTPMHSPLP